MNMKKELCHWCEKSKIIMVPANFLMVAAHGHENAADISNVYLISKEDMEKKYDIASKGGMCIECWTDSYSKTHPFSKVIDINDHKSSLK